MPKFVLVAILIAATLVTHVAPITSAGGGVRDVTTYGLRINPIVDGMDISIYGPGRDLLIVINGPTANYRISDHLASSRLFLDDSKVARYEYDPYGAVATGGDDARYAGHPYDARPGAYTTPNRTYDPSSGRFLSLDPARNAASPYSYAGGDPVNYLDPTGDIRIPYFIETNMAGITGQASLANMFGAPSRTAIVSSNSFHSKTDRPEGSRAGRDIERSLTGRNKVAGGIDRTGEVFWFIGGEKTERLPNVYVGVMDKWRTIPGHAGVGERVVFIDLSKNTGSGQSMAKELLDAGKKAIHIDVEHYAVNQKMSKSKGPIFNEFVVDKVRYDRKEFRDYVYSKMEETWDDYRRPDVTSDVAVRPSRIIGPVRTPVRDWSAPLSNPSNSSSLRPPSNPVGVTVEPGFEPPWIQPVLGPGVYWNETSPPSSPGE